MYTLLTQILLHVQHNKYIHTKIETKLASCDELNRRGSAFYFFVNSIRDRDFVEIVPIVCAFECCIAELSTGRMDLRVGSGRVTILSDLAGRVSTSDFLVFY